MIHPKEVPPEAILLAVYLELQNGKSLQSVDFQSAREFWCICHLSSDSNSGQGMLVCP